MSCCLAKGLWPALLVAAGCATVPVRRVGDHLTGDPSWPRGEGRRIAFVGELRVPENLGIERSFWARVWAALTGEEQSPELFRPMAVAIAADGRIAVADPGRRRVQVYEPSENRVVTATAGLKYPVALAFVGTLLMVGDAETGQLSAFDSEASPVPMPLKLPALGRPAGLAVDERRERLFVADPVKHCLHVLSLDGGEPTVLGRRGGELGEFNFPIAVAVDPSGRVYVSDAMNFRVQLFDADLRPVRAFGQLGDAPGRMGRPKGVAVDREGVVYLVEGYFGVVQAFDDQGQLLGVIGGEGTTPGRFWLPGGLAIDASNRLLVADTWNGRVQLFALDRRGP